MPFQNFYAAVNNQSQSFVDSGKNVVIHPESILSDDRSITIDERSIVTHYLGNSVAGAQKSFSQLYDGDIQDQQTPPKPKTRNRIIAEQVLDESFHDPGNKQGSFQLFDQSGPKRLSMLYQD